MAKKLFLLTVGINRTDTIGAIRQVTGLYIAAAKDIYETVASGKEQEIVFESAISIEIAEKMMRSTGAKIEIRESDPLALTEVERAVIDAARDLQAITDVSYMPPGGCSDAHNEFLMKLRARLDAAYESLARAQEPPP